MKLKVGNSYERADGAIIKIQDSDTSADWPYMDTGGRWYAEDGTSIDGSSGDIVREYATAASEPPMLLPTDPAIRKDLPITSGVLDYFPLAIAEVARVSKAGNDQHNPGQPLHWDKTKSLDHADCIPRHLIDRGARDTDGQRHSAKLAWRALALLETQLQAERDGA